MGWDSIPEESEWGSAAHVGDLWISRPPHRMIGTVTVCLTAAYGPTVFARACQPPPLRVLSCLGRPLFGIKGI
jgi:hypothetical protein